MVLWLSINQELTDCVRKNDPSHSLIIKISLQLSLGIISQVILPVIISTMLWCSFSLHCDITVISKY